jgi:small subunit ribosomal protein S4
MKVGPKYKIARRLGPSVFEKTQSQKFAISAGNRAKPAPGSNPKTSYGLGMLEKQRVRYGYLLSAKQLTNYVRAVIAKKSRTQAEDLFAALESRLDNVVLRAGFAPTRSAAKQMASHGHMTVNGRRVTVPSYKLKKGDVVAVREGSKTRAIFNDFEKKLKEAPVPPAWLKVDAKAMLIKVDGEPVLKAGETPFDLTKVLEFYKR